MRRVTVCLTESQVSALDRLAKEKSVSRSALVREIIDEYLKRQNRKDILKYQGIDWEGDLNEMRKGRFDE